MLKFMRSRGPHLSLERQRLQKELFSFKKTVSHGFPARPTCLAYDKALNLLALGTRSGQIRVFGKPGVELEFGFETETSVSQIQFIEKKGQLVVLCEDSSLHLFEINEQTSSSSSSGKTGDILERVKTCDYFSKEQEKGSLKQVTTVLVDSIVSNLLVGTRGGSIYLINLETFTLTNQIIYTDVILQNIPEEHKKRNPGEVEQILEHPKVAGKYLIAFSKGLLVLWDNKNLVAEHFYISSQQVESVDWLSSGEQFVTSHNDGSIIEWKISDNLTPSEVPKITYGPFPCKPITKIYRKTVKNQEDYVIFSGGMPRASYGDKHTISVIQGNPEEQGKHQVLDFTSKVIDFIIVDHKDEEGFDNPSTLIALTEEELVAIDLTHPDWLQYKLPYLSSVHSSPITTCVHYTAVSATLLKGLNDAGQKQADGKYTSKEWPVQGGTIGTDEDLSKEDDLLITGHEDGSVRFWSTGGHHFLLINILNTSKLFVSLDDDIAPIDGDEIDEMNGEEWPPFRKVGVYDPFSDDARLAIRKIVLSPSDGVLTVAGSAGQVMIFKSSNETVEKPLPVVTAKLIEDSVEGSSSNFIWTGHGKLDPVKGNIKFENGFHGLSLVQIMPPAAVTALTCHSDWALIAAGTSHGFTVFDYMQSTVVLSKCTLTTIKALNTVGSDGLITRRKSFKKSLRESIRRLRKSRSRPKAKSSDGSSSPSPSPTKLGKGAPIKSAQIQSLEERRKTAERQVEARQDDEMGCVVRCACFARTPMTTNSAPTPTFWVGTNAGLIYVYALIVPSSEKRESTSVTCKLGKEIQLRHGAPVVYIHVMDSAGHPMQESKSSDEKSSSGSSSLPSRVLICSEEQFKLFTLPSLKPYCKYKLTAHEGSRARRIAIAEYGMKIEDNVLVEHCLLCLTNQGDIVIHTLNDLKRQLSANCTKKQDINGITSLVFTKKGEGFYLQTSSEFRRFSTSAGSIQRGICHIDLPEGSRPVKSKTPATSSSADTSHAEGSSQKISSGEKRKSKASPSKEAVISEEVSLDDTPEINGMIEVSLNEVEPETQERPIDVEPSGSSKVTKKPPIVNGSSERDAITDPGNDVSIVSSESMDITVDSVEDHMTSTNSVTIEVNSIETVRETEITSTETITEGSAAVINSNED